MRDTKTQRQRDVEGGRERKNSICVFGEGDRAEEDKESTGSHR